MKESDDTDKIVLDIGGRKFATSRSTILSYKGSRFDSISNGQWKPEADGSYFVDRDPEYFSVLLNYLRSGKVNLSKYRYNSVLEDLQAEFDFYGLKLPEVAPPQPQTQVKQTRGFNSQHDKLAVIQSEIEVINDEAAEVILEAEMNFIKLRRPCYKKRNEIIRDIPNFWLKVCQNHPIMGELLTEEDKSAFKHLTELLVEEFDDIKSGFKIHLNFDTNPFFENKVLSKDFNYSKEGILKVTPTKVEWKGGQNLTKARNIDDATNNGDTESFFNWFNEDDQDIELGEIIKDELWTNPLKYYDLNA